MSWYNNVRYRPLAVTAVPVKGVDSIMNHNGYIFIVVVAALVGIIVDRVRYVRRQPTYIRPKLK